MEFLERLRHEAGKKREEIRLAEEKRELLRRQEGLRVEQEKQKKLEEEQFCLRRKESAAYYVINSGLRDLIVDVAYSLYDGGYYIENFSTNGRNCREMNLSPSKPPYSYNHIETIPNEIKEKLLENDEGTINFKIIWDRTDSFINYCWHDERRSYSCKVIKGWVYSNGSIIMEGKSFAGLALEDYQNDKGALENLLEFLYSNPGTESGEYILHGQPPGHPMPEPG